MYIAIQCVKCSDLDTESQGEVSETETSSADMEVTEPQAVAIFQFISDNPDDLPVEVCSLSKERFVVYLKCLILFKKASFFLILS